MRKVVLGTLAALALTLGIAAPQASAAWATRPVTVWDASCGRYVTTTQRYWVPNPVVVVPAPYHRHVVTYGPAYRRHVETHVTRHHR